jgi:hypothetical protein
VIDHQRPFDLPDLADVKPVAHPQKTHPAA